MLNYRAPGIRNADLSMLKAFAVREGMRGEFRFDVQNAHQYAVLWRAEQQLWKPRLRADHGLQGQPRSESGQLGLKFRF